MKDDDGEFDAATLRELAYFTLAGAQIFASDTLSLPRSSLREHPPERRQHREETVADFGE